MAIDFETIIQESKASQNKDELRELLPLVAKISPKVIVEIGMWRGYSMELWHKAFAPEILITIENDQEAINFVRDRIKNGELAYMNPPAIGISGNSHDPKTLANVAGLLKGRKIDFLFIDGDHTYNAVGKDFLMYMSLMRPGGIIALHDAALRGNEKVEVWRFWDELRGYNKKLIVGKEGTGTGVIFL